VLEDYFYYGGGCSGFFCWRCSTSHSSKDLPPETLGQNVALAKRLWPDSLVLGLPHLEHFSREVKPKKIGL